MSDHTRRQLISEARFRAGVWLETDIASGAVDSIKESHPHLTEAELLVIEREIARIAALLIRGGTPR